jgi:hypothetical protein
MVFGGCVRIIADQSLFTFFRIEVLWTDHDYSRYIYKVLGAFVICLGVFLFVIVERPSRYAPLIRIFSAGFLLIGLVMSIGGILSGLSLIHYLPDFIYCFLVSVLLLLYRERNPDI